MYDMYIAHLLTFHQSLRMQPELEFDKPWKTGFLLDHVECTKDLKWMSHDAQLIIQTQGSE